MKKSYSANELQAINSCLEDASVFKSAITKLLELPEKSYIANGLYPDLIMFTIESFDTITSIEPECSGLFDCESIESLRVMRHRAKLLEYDKDIYSGIEELDNIDYSQIEDFNQNHTGLLSRFKRLIQPDLALVNYDGHLIFSSHTLSFYLGSNIELNRNYITNLGRVLGEYIQTLMEAFDLNECKTHELDKSKYSNYKDIEIKSKNLFVRSKFSSKNKIFSSTLILVLARMNYTMLILSQLLPSNSQTFFRVKFINAYHGLMSLNKIQSLVMKNKPSVYEIDYFKSIFGDKDAKWLMKQSSLRNYLTHYLLDSNQQKKVSSNTTRREVIKKLSKGKGMIEIEMKLNKVINTIIYKTEWLFELKADTFWLGEVKL